MNDASEAMKYIADADLPHRVLDGQAIIIDSRLRQVHLFNETGTRIWELLKTPNSVAAIAGALAEEYAVDMDSLAPQVQAFVDTLVSMKLALQRDGR